MTGGGVKLLVWNCAGRLRQNYRTVESLKPDIAVICEVSEEFSPNTSDALWLIPPGKRGVGILSWNGWMLENTGPKIDELCFLPCEVSKGNTSFNLVGTCVKRAGDYVTPTLGALAKLEAFLLIKAAILAGDFNQSAAFARTPSKHFQRVIDHLHSLHMKSAWHSCKDEKFGQESTPTFFRYWRNTTGNQFHIDYAFLSSAFSVEYVQIGSYEKYTSTGLSDHVPLVADLSIK